MTTEELRWLVGLAVGLLATIGGMLLGAFRSLAGRIERTGADLGKADDALHERVNGVRDEYVRRVDLDGHMQRIDRTLQEVRDEQKEMNRAVLTALQGGARRGNIR